MTDLYFLRCALYRISDLTKTKVSYGSEYFAIELKKSHEELYLYLEGISNEESDIMGEFQW